MNRAISALMATSALFCTTLGTSVFAATPILDSSGKLTGATGVNVLGTSYDVAFLDGTCASVFDGCDSEADFAFSNSQEAMFAGRALLDQVFVGSFDDNPALTSGCTDPLRCIVWFPYHVSGAFIIDVGVTQNSSLELSDFSSHGTFLAPYPDFSPAGTDSLVWARFTRAVPEPSTWAMVLLGFGAVGAAIRRHRRKPSLRSLGFSLSTHS